MTRKKLTLGHSPDPDDAFMFFGLASGRIETFGWQFEHVLQDIQTLNDRALREELDITALSIHAYPFVAERYVLTNCGSSMGDGYGPMIVARESLTLADLTGRVIAVPGERTTAFLALKLCLGRQEFSHRVVMFDRILDAVSSGEVDAGLIIHEGQLTFHRHGLHRIVDLGEWWKSTTGLPLPLGGNVIRRALGVPAMTEITAILKNSIEFSLAHREEAVDYALQFGRDLDRSLTNRFVGMYVNSWTVDYGEIGRQAVRELLRRANRAGMTPDVEVEFVGT